MAAKWTWMLMTLVFFVHLKIVLRKKKSLDIAIELFIDNKVTLKSKECEVLSFGEEHDNDLLTTRNLRRKLNSENLQNLQKKWSLINI